MPDQLDQILSAVLEIKGLISLLAEPAIAQRDEKRRAAVHQLVGKSATKAKAVLLMDGTRTQSQISQASNIDKGDLSKLVRAFRQADLISEGDKPLLKIPLPPTFFD